MLMQLNYNNELQKPSQGSPKCYKDYQIFGKQKFSLNCHCSALSQYCSTWKAAQQVRAYTKKFPAQKQNTFCDEEFLYIHSTIWSQAKSEAKINFC